jgi:soluble lytic murein transglycosylase
MPQVPLLNPGGAVAPNELPGPQITTAATGGRLAAQLQDLGEKLETAGDNYVMLQNQVRVNDAMNQARQSALDLTFNPQYGYQAQRGVDALQRASGQPLPVEYGQKLNDSIERISSNLTPAQQRVFRMQSADLQTNFVGSVQQHMLQQGQQYALSVQGSTLKLAGDQAAQYWNQPDKINGEGGLVQQAQAAAYATGKLTGMDTQAMIQEAGSSIHRSVIQSALENGNPLYAQQYAEKYKSQMTTDDILRVQGSITQQANAQIAQLAVGHAVTQLQPSAAPTNLDRLNTLVQGAESGGRETNPDGSTITSSAGAKGINQVLDSTAGQPGFGITPAKKLANGEYDPDDRARVGKQYLGALVQRYGNVAQALAAYHDGPSAVDKAIKETSDVGEPGIWLQSAAISDTGRAYVTTIMPKYNQGAGAQPMPTKEQFVQSALSTLGPNTTIAQQSLVRQAADARYQTLLDSRNEQGDNALRAVQQALVQNGGDYAALQRDQPQLVSALVQAAPGKVDDAMRYGRELANGDRPDNVTAYSRAVMYPQEMVAMKDADFENFITTNFSKTTGERLAKLRANLATGSSDDSAQAINNTAFNNVLKERLNNIGLDATPKATDVQGNQRVGAVQKFLRDGLYAAQQQAGKKFTPAEVGEFIDNAFRQNTVLPHWYGDSTKPVLSMQWGDVPGDAQRAIEERMPNASPTDKLRTYWTWLQAQPKPKAAQK